MAYCGPQAGGPGSLETSQLDGEWGARVESNSEGASPNLCGAPPGAVKPDKEKLEQNTEEASELKQGQRGWLGWQGAAREGVVAA